MSSSPIVCTFIGQKKVFASCKEIQIPESKKFLLVESGIQLKQFGIPQKIGNRNLSSIDKDRGIQWPESGIHGVEPRIQDCPGFPYMGRKVFTGLVLLWTILKRSLKTKNIFFLKTDTPAYTCIRLNHCITKYKFYDFKKWFINYSNVS